jgi:predicted anti-sigma-YlaC factor YlaD
MWGYSDGSDRLSTANEITCAELVEIVTDYLEGTMQEADRCHFEAHLDECAYCRNYLEQMRQTIAALGELREESIPPDAREALLETFRGCLPMRLGSPSSSSGYTRPRR